MLRSTMVAGLIAVLCALSLGAATAATQEVVKSVDASDGWRLTSHANGVSIYARIRAGTHLKEFKAIGDIDAPTNAVNGVLEDIGNYPRFMPYTAECRLIKTDGESIIAYQRISPKICDDRDYTLRIRKRSWSTPAGTAFMHEWIPANEFGPPEKKGVVRVKTSEGAWLLEPVSANKTRATYWLYSDTGGAIPAFFANYASQTGIGKIFAAVRKQVTDPKYQKAAENAER